MGKWKRRLIVCAGILSAFLALGGWAFHHWLGFMLRSPMPGKQRGHSTLSIDGEGKSR